MLQLPIEQQILLGLEILALLALCVRIWSQGLYKVYSYFFGYLILEVLQALIPVLVPLRSRLYRDLYLVSQALLVGFAALVVLELYSKVLRDLTGIAGIARRYIKVTLVVALVIAFLPLLVEKSEPTMMGYLFSYEQTVMLSLVVFLLLASVFLVYYPVPLGKNVIIYLTGYTLYFLTTSTLTFINNMGYIWNRVSGSLDMGVLVSCVLFWLFALSRRGEEKRLVVGHQWNLADEQKLRAQLDAINASLLRAGGKS